MPEPDYNRMCKLIDAIGHLGYRIVKMEWNGQMDGLSRLEIELLQEPE